VAIESVAVSAPARRTQRLGALRALWRLLRGGDPTPFWTAVSVFVGVYIGCQPVYGLHLVLCLVVCLPLRLDVVVAYLAANISNPVFAPFLLYAEAETGAWLLTGRPPSFDLSLVREATVQGLAWHVVVGAQIVGLGLASGFGALALGLSAGLRRGKRRVSAAYTARSRTIRRYSKCKFGDRMYVAMKLELDPLTRALEAFDAPLGRVLDVGCGRGQFSLLLRELELADSAAGFDWDPRKVSVAQEAAGADARYAVGDALTAELPACDTLLIFDVLHYLELPAQRELLERLARCVAEGGRLLIREMDGHAGWSSELGQWFERVATKSGYNRARQALCFQPLRALLDQLEALGFDCEYARKSSRWSGPNVLVVAKRRS